MKYGLKTTKVVIGIILIVQIICLIAIHEMYDLQISARIYYILLAALSLNFIIILLMNWDSLFLKYSQLLLKISMVIGLSTLFL
jgi:hypothetical protein